MVSSSNSLVCKNKYQIVGYAHLVARSKHDIKVKKSQICCSIYSVFFPLSLRYTYKNFCTSAASLQSSIEPAFFLRLCTVLYKQQTSPSSRLHSNLDKLKFTPTHELFIQVCNKFPYSWRPVHNLFQYSKIIHNFEHTSTTANKALDVFGKARNIEHMSNFLKDMASQKIVNQRTLEIAATHFAGAREIKKCAALFELDDSFKNVDVLNRVVSVLCAQRYVDVAKAIVFKVKDFIRTNEATFGFLVVGFCQQGDLSGAGRVWNTMINYSLEPTVDTYEEIVVTLFKNNRIEDAMGLFKTMRCKRFGDMGLASYKVVITWMSKGGKTSYAYMMLCEMLKRGVGIDNSLLGDIIYMLLVRKRVREAYKILREVEAPDISIYHGLIKGFLRQRKPREATQVFREMIERGCEPIMHTYIMLLQGHLGKRGRKARDPLVNFESIFVGGLITAGKTRMARKYVERMKWGGREVPRFDYNKFLHCFSNEEGIIMFEEVGKRLKEVGYVDLGDLLLVYGQRMSTRVRRVKARAGYLEKFEDSDGSQVDLGNI